MWAAVQNQRVDFSIANVTMNNVIVETARTQFRPYSTSGTTYNCNTGISSPSSHWGTQVIRSVALNGNPDMAYSIANPSELNTSNSAMSLKAAGTPTTAPNFAYSGFSGKRFTPTSNKIQIDLEVKLAEHFQSWWTMGTFMYITSSPTIVLNMKYKTSNIEFKTNNAVYGNVIIPNYDNSPKSSITFTPSDLNSMNGDYLLAGQAVPNNGYVFLYWKKAVGDTEEKNIYNLSFNTTRLYNHNYNDATDGKIVYEAIFDELKITDLINNTTNYVYNGVGQGPRIFVDYPFTDINHQVVHSYKAQSGTTFTSVNVQINSTTQSLEKADTDLLIAKIPRNSGSYVYTAEVKRLINGTYTTVGLLNNNREINFSISRYTPTASVVENDVTLAPYYYGQKISSSYLISPISTTFNSVFLKDSYIRGENNQIIGEITGSYSFENNTYNTGTTRLISTVFGATIKFVPIDPNIETIILSGSINIGITKTTLKLGYVDPSFNLGISNLQLNVLTYGQTRDNLGVQNKIVLYNPYTYDDPIAIQDPQFTYVPYQISSWGIIDERPATTEQLSNATLQFTLSGNMPESVNSWNTVYNLPTEQIEVKYQVNKASLVFSGQEDQKLTFKYNDYKNATNTVYSNIVLMYGQGLKAVTITPSGTIASNVQGYIDSGIIKFAWYKQNEYGGQGESMSDYYEQKLLTVLDSTNPYGATKNYYCIKADWMIVDGSTENSNYEPIYFYNQSITITKAKLNDKSKFEQSTESGDETKPVIKWITYGEHVNNALSTNVNVGTTLNIVNQDLEVYYKIEWITDSQGGSIAMLTNYPYALVENSSQYAVKITILKWNGSSYVTDSDNYEQNGVFARNETGGAFAYASLVVTRATQQFYLEVDNSLVNVTNSNLIKSMINVNDNIFEEKTENLVIESDKNIDLETIYIATNNQFKIVIYTSAVIYKGEEILSITGKAAATLTAFYPAIYNVTSEPVVNYSIECFSGIPYSKIEFTITLSPRAADPGVLSLRIGQYDSGFELSNPTDGNYFSKEWNPAISESDPFTIFIKINKNPKGIKPQNIYNPDDNSVEQLYSYKEYYGSSILIEPLAAVPGTLSYPKNDGYITITQDLNATNETYLITSTTIGSYKLLYTAPGHVNLITPLNDPYMPINQEIWIYFAKKQSTVNILIDSKTATKYTYGELSPTVNYGTVGFLNDDFDAIKALIKLYFMSDNSDYKSNVILNAKEYFINASIDFDSTNISGIDNETLKNAREIAKRYNITFNPVKIEVEPKTIIITFTDSSQFTIDNEIKIFEIDYFDDNLYDANNYPYTYTFVGILEGEDLNEVIGDELTRPSVRAMNTTNSVEYYPISARPSAGSYEIQKYEPDNCPAVNYTFNIERAILRVKTRDVTLDFDEAAQNYTSSSYTFESNARFSGIEGATSPTGNLIIKFLKTGTVVSENTEFLTSLQHAGVYDVYVSYLSGNLDNYNNTDKVFSEYIIINRIDPIVTLPSHNSTYDGIQITYPYNIRGIAADYTLPGETLVYYSTNGSDYSESIPTNAGEYYVKLCYTSAATDNYNAIVVTSDGAVITIEKASLSITSSKLASKLMKTYDAKYIRDLNDIIVAGAPADGTISNEYLDIYYQRTGATEWTLWSVSSTPIDVGNYDIRLDYRTNDNQNISHNYSITSVSYRNGAIIISQKPLESISVKNEFKITKDYNGIRNDIAVDSNHVIIEYGIESSDITPTTINYSDISIEYAKVTYDGNAYDIGAYSSLAPMDAGSYIVRLTYNSKSASNYANGEFSISEIKTDEELSSNVKIEIKKIKPTISYTTTKLPYNAQNQAFTRYSVKGIGNEKPKGAFTIYYQKFGTTDEWVTTTPKDIAKYNIKIEFKAASTENYTNAEAEYSGIFEIINGNLSVTLLIREEDYQGVPVDKAKPLILKPDGKPADSSKVSIMYRLNGNENNEWNISPPSDSGWYDILIEVDTEEIQTYMKYSNIFTKILRIKNPVPRFEVQNYSKIYDGNALSLPLSYILLTNSDHGSVNVSDVNNSNDILTGNVNLMYTTDGTSWSAAPPVNAGTYYIKILYTEGKDDHFSTVETSVFNSAKYTISPLTIVIVPDSNQSKIYDGIPISGDEIKYKIKDDIIPQNNVKTGTLVVANNSINVGSYRINLGALSYGVNYALSLDSTPVYFNILKKDITPIFEEVSYVYDGIKKKPRVYINQSELAKSDTTDDVRLVTSITDNINSGIFTVSVSIQSNSNYKLHDSFVPNKNYLIEKAIMTKNSFSTKEGESLDQIIINYTGVPYDIALGQREPGSNVNYYLKTQVDNIITPESVTSFTEVGEYQIEALITKANYEDQTLTVLLKIVKGTLKVEVIIPNETFYYGNPLPLITTLANGNIVLDSDQTLIPGSAWYNWTFTPNDDEHYLITKGKVYLTVEKALPDVKITGSLEQTVGAPESLDVKVYVDNAEYTVKPRVSYKSADGVEYLSIPTSPGTYTMIIDIQGDEYISQQTIQREFVVLAKPIIWPYVVGGTLIVLFIIIIVVVGMRKRILVK